MIADRVPADARIRYSVTLGAMNSHVARGTQFFRCCVSYTETDFEFLIFHEIDSHEDGSYCNDDDDDNNNNYIVNLLIVVLISSIEY